MVPRKHGAALLSREPYEPCTKYLAATLSNKWPPSLAGAETIVVVATTAREEAILAMVLQDTQAFCAARFAGDGDAAAAGGDTDSERLADVDE